MNALQTRLLVLLFIVAASATAEVYPEAIKLDAPLSTSEAVLSADQIGLHLRRMDEGTSPLSIEDRRIVLETALHSLVKASIPEASLPEFKGGDGWGSTHLVYALKKARDPDWKESDSPHYWISSLSELTPAERDRLETLQNTYLKHLDPDRVRSRDDRILSVAALEGFGLVYAGLQIVALHDRLNLGWRNLNVTWVLPSLLYEGAVRAAKSYAKNYDDRPLNDYVRLLAALRRDAKLTAGPQVLEQFEILVKSMRQDLYDEVDAIGSWAIHPYIDTFSRIVSTTWLSAFGTATPFGIYHAVTYGLPQPLLEHPVAYVANVGALVATPLLLNVVARGRMRDREARLKADVNRLVDACENALKPERHDGVPNPAP